MASPSAALSFVRTVLPVLFDPDAVKASRYKDRCYEGSDEQYFAELAATHTLYVGNLSFYTCEEQIYEFFAKVAPVKRLIMGLDRALKTPCGFCFIEYYSRADAVRSKRLLNGMRLDERFIRIDYDVGFKEGRQFGRGKRGGQVRDEHRREFDEGRGGWGPTGPASADGPEPSSTKRARIA